MHKVRNVECEEHVGNLEKRRGCGVCLKESCRYYCREIGDIYEDLLTCHLHDIRLIKNRSRVSSWSIECCGVLPLCVCVCVRECMCILQRSVGCAWVLEERAVSIFEVKISRSNKCSGCIEKRPHRLVGEEEFGPSPREMERWTGNCEIRPISVSRPAHGVLNRTKKFFIWKFRHLSVSLYVKGGSFRLHRWRRFHILIQFSVKWIMFLWVLRTQWRNKFDKLSSF